MPISSITVENFKGIQHSVKIDFKPITLLFGPNSAGKSSIVQALHYALEVFERNNLDPDKTSIGGKAVDLGGFATLVYNHDVSKPIRLKIELDLQDEDLPQYFDGYEDMGLSQFSDKQIGEIPMRAVSAAVELSVKWMRRMFLICRILQKWTFNVITLVTLWKELIIIGNPKGIHTFILKSEFR